MQERLLKYKIYLIPVFFGLILLSIFGYITFTVLNNRAVKSSASLPTVSLPTIDANGDLVLSVATDSGKTGKSLSPTRLGVISANLSAIYDKEKMTGIRILGEVSNLGDVYVNGIDPLVRFFDSQGAVVAQKIARFSGGFDFKEVPPKDKVLYDVTVDSPPVSERLEIVLNVTSSSDSAKFLPLKIASRAMELKTAEVQSQESSGSAQKVEYFTVSGKVVNTYENLVSDISIYAWGKNAEGKVFAFGRADFKNDLLSPADKVDFKIIMLPIQSDQKLETYEVAAWGKEYRLLTSPAN